MPFTTQNDADTVDPESLYDEAAEEIGNLEQKEAKEWKEGKEANA